MKTAPLDDYEEEPRGLWARIKEKVGFGEYEDEVEEVIEATDGARRRPVMLRVSASRQNKVSVWMSVTNFDNAQQAADGLKEGRQQIVNLEKATPEVTARVIDFLSGVTYALDGFIERVGEKVYLFTPANFAIEVESGTEKQVKGSFFGN